MCSDLCVRIGERSSKRRFPHFKLCLYAYRAVMAVGVGIFPFCILYNWQSMYVFRFIPSKSHIM